MRVFTAALATETNTFGPMPTGIGSFEGDRYFRSDNYPAQGTLFSGPVWAARHLADELALDVIQGLVAETRPSGITTRQAFERLRDEILDGLSEAMPVDMVLLGLHGAMVADGYDDCEGHLLDRVRTLVGPTVVVGAELDNHCHLTDLMVSKAHLLIAFKEYPHTDIRERGIELVRACVGIAQGAIKPVAEMVDTQMIVTMHTTREPARGFVDRIKAMEGKNGILSVSIAHGFAWGDVAAMGTRVLVYADGDGHAAAGAARDLARELIEIRQQVAIPYVDNDAALDQALSCTFGPVVIADTSDNAGGGAASDSTFLLQCIFERQLTGVVVGPLWDAAAVAIAFEAGEGASLLMRIGGKTGPMSGVPLDLMCTVKSLRRNATTTGLGGTSTSLGDCAVVESSGVEILLVSKRNQAIDTDIFTGIGCTLDDKKIIVVKSAQHFFASFSKIAGKVIYASGPGTVARDFTALPYKHINRPKWPIDGDFVPVVPMD